MYNLSQVALKVLVVPVPVENYWRPLASADISAKSSGSAKRSVPTLVAGRIIREPAVPVDHAKPHFPVRILWPAPPGPRLGLMSGMPSHQTLC